MAQYFFIAIGGTGSKCLESFVFCSALGLAPNNVSILVIDPDKRNGNGNDLVELIGKYNKCYDIMGNKNPIFRTQIVANDIVWSPTQNSNSLRELFDYNVMLAQNPILAKSVKLFFSEDEINQEWNGGFHGRAAMGTPIMSDIKKAFDENPWSDFLAKIEASLANDNDARVFIVGSIFGATGASGFPIISQLLREKFQRYTSLKIAGGLIMPYFGFKESIKKKQDSIPISSKDFFIKTKVALKYYYDHWKLSESSFNRVYCIGENELAMEEDGKTRKNEPEGRAQNNFAHYVEFLAALSSIHFFTDGNINDARNEQYLIARNDENKITWKDFPNSNRTMASVQHLALTAMSYNSFVYPLLTSGEISEKKLSKLVYWYKKGFKNLDLQLSSNKDGLTTIKKFNDKFINWLYEISHSSKYSMELFSAEAVKSCTANNYGHVDSHYIDSLCSPINTHPEFLDQLWDEMCSECENQLNERMPVKKLINLIYTSTQNVLNKTNKQ